MLHVSCCTLVLLLIKMTGVSKRHFLIFVSFARFLTLTATFLHVNDHQNMQELTMNQSKTTLFFGSRNLKGLVFLSLDFQEPSFSGNHLKNLLRILLGSVLLHDPLGLHHWHPVQTQGEENVRVAKRCFWQTVFLSLIASLSCILILKDKQTALVFPVGPGPFFEIGPGILCSGIDNS